MNHWSKEQIEAYVALGDGGHLIDPRYAPHPEREEARLKAVVEKNWAMRLDFPDWVGGYIKKWDAEKAKALA